MISGILIARDCNGSPMPDVSELETVLADHARDATEVLARALWYRYAPSLGRHPDVTDEILDAVTAATADLPPSAHALGTLLESVMDPDDRTRAGAFFTPPDVAAALVERILGPINVETPRVCDPACGCGIFLEAAAMFLIARGVTPREAVTRCLAGADRSGAAISICRLVLWRLADDATLDPAVLHDTIRVGDSMLGTDGRLGIGDDRDELDAWCAEQYGPNLAALSPIHWHVDFARPDARSDQGSEGPGFDAVMGNPPFLNQLAGDTARGSGERSLVRARLDNAVSGYADAASCFLVLASRLTRDGGRFGMIQPISLLGARDAAGARRALTESASLDALWIARDKVFDASPDVCAPIFTRGAEQVHGIARWQCRNFAPMPESNELPEATSWAPLAAAAFDIPEIVVRTRRVLGDVAKATADFRDQYYGLRGFVTDVGDATDPPLVTTAHVDAARSRWGMRPVKFDGQSWTAPRVRLAALRETALARWADTRLVPKVLVATQTPTIEAVVDAEGAWLPSVPLITVVANDPDDLWPIAAALTAPIVSAVAARRFAGTARSTRAIKLSARQLLELPLPVESRAWAAMTDAYRRASASHDERIDALGELAGHAGRAYGLAPRDQVIVDEWWAKRLR